MPKRPDQRSHKLLMTATLKGGDKTAEFFIHLKTGALVMWAPWDNVTERDMRILVRLTYKLWDCLDASQKCIEREGWKGEKA